MSCNGVTFLSFTLKNYIGEWNVAKEPNLNIIELPKYISEKISLENYLPKAK